ncbi:MAG TPA: hypothetical protein VFI65_21125 [Streptosporangiaceae bacterium]|nr:hypothetical protein [Streptosporangiaceae bacterium]
MQVPAEPRLGRPATHSTATATRRRGAGARFFSPAQIITLAVALALGSGSAAAANGMSFLLGRANHESSTAALSDSKGTPLSLSAPSGHAPLAVNRRTLVKKLNAQYLDGFAAGRLRVLGGVMYTPPGTNTPINSTGKLIVTTGPLPAGTYYVTATAELNLDSNDGSGHCWIAKGSNPSEPGHQLGRRRPASGRRGNPGRRDRPGDHRCR